MAENEKATLESAGEAQEQEHHRENNALLTIRGSVPDQVLDLDTQLDNLHSFPSYSKLPPEIWKMILSDANLSLKDLKNARHTSKQLAELSLAPIFKTCVIKRNRDDHSRLTAMLQQSAEQFAKDIKALRFETGCIDPNVMGHNMMLAKFMDHSDQCQARMMYLYYNLWKHRHDKIAGHDICSNTLGEIMKVLAGVERIDITNRSCPLEGDTLIEAWMQGNVETRCTHDTRSFRSILEAILESYLREDTIDQNATQKFRHLTHDALPMEFLDPYSNSRGISALAKVCRRLETLHIGFIVPHDFIGCNLFWKSLSSCLQQAANLADLRLGFDPLYRGYEIFGSEPGQESVRLNDACWTIPDEWFAYEHYISLHLMFPSRNTWKNLKSLRLEGLLVCEHGLEHVVLKLQTVQKLYLCHMGLSHGTWKSLLGKIRQSLRLKSFRLWGEIASLHGHNENWVLPPPADVWEDMANKDGPGIENRIKAYQKSMSEDRPHQQRQLHAREGIEAYVLGHGEWPSTLLDEISLPHPPIGPSTVNNEHDLCIIQAEEDEEEEDDVYCQDFDEIEKNWKHDISEQELISIRSEISPYDYRAGNLADFPLLIDDLDVHGIDREMTEWLRGAHLNTIVDRRWATCQIGLIFNILRYEDTLRAEEAAAASPNDRCKSTTRPFEEFHDLYLRCFPDLGEGSINTDCAVCKADEGGTSGEERERRLIIRSLEETCAVCIP